MTRWVRSGSSQKHKKMPGNATKWGEFDNQYANKFLPKKRKNIEFETDVKQRMQSLSTDFPSGEPNESLVDDFFEEDKYCLTENTSLLSELKNGSSEESHSNIIDPSTNDEDDNSILLISKSLNPKIKKKRKSFGFEHSSIEQNVDNLDLDDVSKNNIKGNLEKDSSATISNNILDQDSDHYNSVENKIDTEENNFHQQNKKKRKKKMKEKCNKIVSESLTANDESMELFFNNSDELLDLDENSEYINSLNETNEPNKSFQEIDRSSKKQKRKERGKMNNDSNNSLLTNIDPQNSFNCSITTFNNMLPQNSDHNDFIKNKRKKKNKEKYNKIDLGSSTANDGNMEISYNNSDESSKLGEDVECNSSAEISDTNKLFQKIDKSLEKQKRKKCDKVNSDSNPSSLTIDNSKNSPSKVCENKKEKYLKKLQKKREKLGLLLLPRNVENKLHKIHKRLKEKGFPPEKQKEIMRQARRREELKYRKVFNPSKLCFGCREPGHVLSDCPKKTESLKQETGICFKCGSVEHTSFKCPQKVQGFPYAKCFICKEQGHISRECPKNKHGVYPKGGRCKLCGNVNHLKKDCPTLKKKETEEETITLGTLNENISVDAELMTKEVAEKKLSKKAKIVKF